MLAELSIKRLDRQYPLAPKHNHLRVIADVAVIEVHRSRAERRVFRIDLLHINFRVAVQINLDLPPNEASIGELAKTNMHVPFWKRTVYILRSELSGQASFVKLRFSEVIRAAKEVGLTLLWLLVGPCGSNNNDNSGVSANLNRIRGFRLVDRRMLWSVSVAS